MPTEEKLSKFIEAASEETNEQLAKINKDIDDYKVKTIKTVKAKAAKNAVDTVQKASYSIAQKIGAEISVQTRDERRKVFARRTEIANEVFETAKVEIEAFTKTDDYKTLLKNATQSINAEFSDGNITLFVRSCDVEIVKSITSGNSAFKAVETDDSIILGGVKALNSLATHSIDATLDTRLVLQRTTFENESQLIIKA